VALAVATCVGVACADDPAKPANNGGSSGSAGKGGSSGSGNSGGTAGKGGTGGSNSDGGTDSGGTTNSGGTAGDAGAPGSGGVPGAGGAPVGGEGGELSIGGEGGGGSDPEPPDPNNKLTGDLNPYDFETGSSIWWPFGAPTHGVSEDLAHSGTKSYSATKRLNSYDSPATNITDHIVPDKVYKFTSWIAYPVASAGMQSITMKIKIVGCGSGDIYADLATGGAAVAGGTWFELTGNYTLPDGCTDPTEVDLWWQGATGQGDPIDPEAEPVTYYLTSFYIDDISMVEVP
jgi:hypothetical protein